MKKILFPAVIAALCAFAMPEASAQNINALGGSDSDRPMPTNDERTRDRGAPITDGNPNQELRHNNNPKIDKNKTGTSIDNKNSMEPMPTATFESPKRKERNERRRQQAIDEARSREVCPPVSGSTSLYD